MHLRLRNFGRWLCVLVITCTSSIVVISCGDSFGTSLFDGGARGPDAWSIDDGPGGQLDDGPTLIGEGGGGCMPKSCTDLGFTCGMNTDGCGNVIDCTPAGGSCPAGEFCGGGGYSKCGTGLGDGGQGDGGSTCTPISCQALGVTCGKQGDGCGGVLDCGSCPTGQYCGGGGFNVCGTGTPDGGPVCTPKTCMGLGYNCGAAGDGCGGALQCGVTCPAPQYCGGGGFNTCGGNGNLTPEGGVPCTPTTCAALGFNCGPAGDGCGGALDCGTCGGTDICGGAGKPGVCGNSVACTNLCPKQVQCDGGTQTTITGTVFAGASAWTGLPPDPVPNVLVYVPNAPLQAFTPGASCRQCGADVSGVPLVSTYSDFDGTFTLANVPAGTSFPLVIQLGRWRRQFMIPAVPACTSVATANLNLPRNQSEGEIPLTAISTGSVDALECVLLKMGVDQAEFTPDTTAGGMGRIQIYAGDPGPNGGNPNGGAPGANAGPATRNEPALMGANGTFMNYDQIMFPCWGAPGTKTAAELANLVTYSDSGGHFFATHYNYAWLVNNGEFNNIAAWVPDFDNPQNTTWTLNVSTAVPPSPPSPHVETFAKWLNLVGALSNAAATVPANPQLSIAEPRHDVTSVANGSVEWIDGTDQRPNGFIGGDTPANFNGSGTPLVEHFTFNTPVGMASQCGHDIFSDFHVLNRGSTNGQRFPAECDRTFSPQEKVLEFMIWDLASCVPPPPSPSCTPITCAAQNISCGPAGNGCGGALDCGPCQPGYQCGGGTVHGMCIPIPEGGTCQPQTCMQLQIGCGPAGNGCGGALDCGPCTLPMTCGGGGVPGQCGGSGCPAQTCAQQNIACGPAGDGCGNLLQCGTCPAGQACGGGGIPGQCGGCTPITCAQLNVACGPAGDGCGNLLQCGVCAPPDTCGGGGVPGQCGGIAK